MQSGSPSDGPLWARFILSVHSRIARFVMWAGLLMVIWQFLVVVLQHVFGFGIIWMQDLLLYLHAFMFIGTVSFVLAEGGQVRIDIYFCRLSPRRQAQIDIIGCLGLIIPFGVVVLYFGTTYVLPSWRVLEGAVELEGIPLVFVLKTLIPLLGLSLILQALAITGCRLTFLQSLPES